MKIPFMNRYHAYWIRDSSGDMISLFVVKSESALRMAGQEGVRCVEEVQHEVERLAEAATRRGSDSSIRTGSFVQGDGNGQVTATGVADIFLTPGVEHRLMEMGLAEAK